MQMAYQALYRVWRPQKFRDIIGQEHITRTLSNAVAYGLITHAYLFSGPRGTGKTSTARILAKAVNCPHRTDGEPCGECAICQAVTDGTALDIVEIDAASNNGVDEIRELREKVKYAPLECRYKVYIIDEVHMLSSAAFNALLKTLEEPPDHVIFILATTELQKIPATIKSRCQRFDFRRLREEDIGEHLAFIAKEEKRDIASGALQQMARAADGSLRDAISYLDQAMTLSEGAISEVQVSALIGAVDRDVFARLTDALREGKFPSALAILDEAFYAGSNLEQFLLDYAGYLRDMLLSRYREQSEDGYWRSVGLQARDWNDEALYELIHLVIRALGEIRATPNPKLIVEMVLLEFSRGRYSTEVVASIENQPREIGQRKKTDNAKAESVDAVLLTEDVKPLPIIEEEIISEEVEKSEADMPEEGQNLGLAVFTRAWDKVLEKVKSEDIITHALLDNARPADYEAGVLTLSFSNKFHLEQILSPAKQQIVLNVLEDYFGSKLKIIGIMREEEELSEVEEKADEPEELIQKALRMFGGKIINEEVEEMR